MEQEITNPARKIAEDKLDFDSQVYNKAKNVFDMGMIGIVSVENATDNLSKLHRETSNVQIKDKIVMQMDELRRRP